MLHGLLWLPLLLIFILLTALGWLERRRQNLFRSWASDSELLASDVGEVKYESEWYDYDSKYNQNNNIIIPAEIDSKIKKEIKEIAIKSCRALNIFGFARVDFFLEKSTNKIFLNEINTIPGFTKNSMFPMLWKASGLKIEQLVAKLVDISLGL